MRLKAILALFSAFALAGTALAEGGSGAEGKILFEQKCTSCHTLGAGARVGPDLNGVLQRRTEEWILRFVTRPDRMIAEKDPVAVRLFEQYNRIAMPNLGLKPNEARALLAYLQGATAAIEAAGHEAPATAAADMPWPALAAPQSLVLGAFLLIAVFILLTFAWVGMSTRSPSEVSVEKAYRIRKDLFIAATIAVVVLLITTMPGAPYAAANVKADRIVYVTARQFEFVFSDEPITSSADLGRVPALQRLDVSQGSLVEFRVTSLDVNHGFGVYGPGRQLLAQAQAMPGYVNRLRVRLEQPGQYKVFCLEYCAAGHHFMQSGFAVK